MPHLGELVKLHASEPFALIGINQGDSREVCAKGLAEHKVTWISAYQGDSSPISDLFRITGYPTYILIDAEGRIVKQGHSSEEFDEPIREQLEAMKR